MSDNSSINNLIGTLSTVNTGSFEPIPNEMVCFDTSNNRIGINTIDPSYAIHVVPGANNNATICSSRLILTGLPTSPSGLVTGEVYNDGGTLKIVT